MLLQTLRTLAKRISSYQIPIYAGNATFFIGLAAFPALLLILTLLQFTPYTVEDFTAFLTNFLPASFSPMIAYVTTETFSLNAGAVISITAVTALWSASRGVLGLLNGLNAIYHTEETRSYLHKRLLSLVYMVMFIAAILLTLILYVFSQSIQALIYDKLPSITPLANGLMQFKYVLILGYQTLLFTLIFKVFPNKPMKLRHCLPGALVAAFGWLGFSALYSLYVEHFSNYSRIYGSLTTIVLAMLWLYFCLCILFFGGVVNHAMSQGTALQLWETLRGRTQKPD